jgi:hypothetical protein
MDLVSYPHALLFFFLLFLASSWLAGCQEEVFICIMIFRKDRMAILTFDTTIKIKMWLWQILFFGIRQNRYIFYLMFLQYIRSIRGSSTYDAY